ncbi:MAG: HAMP domain-containing histidine kinase [Actinobacteria bacterium]|nr:HAMP domain-containing histidine kinase [Actinomycetota bacterium]
MKLRARLTMLVTGAVALAVILVSASAFFLARAQMRSVIDESLLDRIAFATRVENASGMMRRVGPLLLAGAAGDLFRLDQYVQVVFADGSIETPLGQELILPVTNHDVAIAAGAEHGIIRDVFVDGLHLRMVTGPAGKGQAVQYARPLTEVDQTLAKLALVLGLVGLGGIAIAAALGMIVSRSSLAPVMALTATAEHVAETQDLEARIDVDRDDEIGRLAASFNTMLEALQTSREQQRRLVADASHELRTPLTSLRTNIEFLARAEGMGDDDRMALMDDVSFEMRELSSLVGEMVELATDPKAGDEPLQGVDLTETVDEVVGRAQRRTGRTIEVSGDAGQIEGRPNSLQRAVSNLIDNAHKWSPPEAPITITLSPGRVEVADRGPGIPTEDLAYVFDRFYRATEARSLPGSGLGLSIVREIVENHGGTVFAFNRDGAVVGFEIPILT